MASLKAWANALTDEEVQEARREYGRRRYKNSPIVRSRAIASAMDRYRRIQKDPKKQAAEAIRQRAYYQRNKDRIKARMKNYRKGASESTSGQPKDRA